MVAPLPELETRMFFDAPERSFWKIPLRVNHRNPSWLQRMLELFVTARLRNLEPAVVFELSYHLSAVHCGASFQLKNTHFVYTLQ
jgi:hypothetical protein